MLLLLGPQTLYSLNKQFEQGPSLFYRASFGSLQSALRGLHAAGHARMHEETDGGRLKKVYEITDAGAATFHAENRHVFRYQRATLDYGGMAHRTALAWFRELAASDGSG